MANSWNFGDLSQVSSTINKSLPTGRKTFLVRLSGIGTVTATVEVVGVTGGSETIIGTLSPSGTSPVTASVISTTEYSEYFFRVTAISGTSVSAICYASDNFNVGTDPNDGEFNVIDFGATGDGSTDDAAAIQAAIDDASSAGGGTVVIPYPAAHYVLGATLTTASNVRLNAAHGAELRMGIDDTVLRVLPNSSVDGGKWVNDFASLSEATPIVHLLSDSSTYFDRDELCSLSNMLIMGPASGILGIGLMYETGGTVGTVEAVQWINASNIVIDGAHKGISLLSNEDSGDSQSFVNGNHFSNIGMDHFVYGIYLEGTGTGTAATSANQFTNVSFQVRGNVINCITIVNNDCRKNSFSNIACFDIGNGALGASTIGIAGTNTPSAKEGNLFTNVSGLLSTQVTLGNNDIEQPTFPAA